MGYVVGSTLLLIPILIIVSLNRVDSKGQTMIWFEIWFRTVFV